MEVEIQVEGALVFLLSQILGDLHLEQSSYEEGYPVEIFSWLQSTPAGLLRRDEKNADSIIP